jgi:hypothetical protein
MQAQAAKSSGCAGLFRCFLDRRIQRQSVSIHLILNQALKQERSACLRVFLARNELVAPAIA